MPASLTVTSPLDDGSSGTLRSVVATATNGDTINFDTNLSGSTINLDPTRGELLISKNLNIVGPGAANLVVSGQNQTRVFEFTAGTTDSISGLTIENGFAVVPGIDSIEYYTNNHATYGGGGAILNAGTLTVSHSALSGNSADGGHHYLTYGGGAAILNVGTLTVCHSTLSGNSTVDYNFGGGGAIYSSGTLTVNDSTLSGNTAASGVNYGRGGAIYSNSSGTLTVSCSTLSSNRADYGGGGIFSDGGNLDVTDSTVSGNSTGYTGGGVYLGPVYAPTQTVTLSGCTLTANTGGWGGGIFSADNYSAVTISGCTLTDNGGGPGGGIANAGTMTMSGCTVSGNNAGTNWEAGSGGGIANSGTLIISNFSVVSGNTAYSGGGISNGGNVIIDSSTVAGNAGGAWGGGVINYGTLTVRNASTISGNTAFAGGGIFNEGGAVLIDGSAVAGNMAVSTGGGIWNEGTLTVGNASNLSGNTASNGGAIYNFQGITTVTGSTLTGNSAVNGAGIYNVLYDECLVKVIDSVITGNTASHAGGGIYNLGSPGYSFNNGRLIVTDSIVCGNVAPIGADVTNLGLFTQTNSDICVIAEGTVTTATSSASPAIFGQAVTFTVTVVCPNGGTPTGTVTFRDWDTDQVLGVGTLDASGHAIFTTSALSLGDHGIRVQYNGAATFADSEGYVEVYVLTAQQELAVIINEVTGLVTAGILSGGNGNALIVRLNSAIASLDRGNTVAAVNQMTAFLNQAQAFLQSGRLDSTDEQLLVANIDLAIDAVLNSGP